MRAILGHIRTHAVAYLALFVALGGTSAAAVTIDGSQIRNHSIDPTKFNPTFINGSVRAWAIVAPNGRVIASAGRPRVTPQPSDPGGYGIGWAVRVGRCATDVTIDYTSSPPTERLPVSGNPSVPFTAGYAVASTNKASSRSRNATFVQTFNQLGQPTPLGFNVAVVC